MIYILLWDDWFVCEAYSFCFVSPEAFTFRTCERNDTEYSGRKRNIQQYHFTYIIIAFQRAPWGIVKLVEYFATLWNMTSRTTGAPALSELSQT